MTNEERAINQRLDELQAMPPTPEITAEYCRLIRELRRFYPQPKPDHPFRRQCWQLRGLIWLSAVSLCLVSLFLSPFFLPHGGVYAGISLFMILCSIASLCWAIWSSSDSR